MNISEKQELYRKYGITEEEHKRVYKITFEKDFNSLECCTPLRLYLLNTVIEDRTWSNLMSKLSRFLSKKFADVNFLDFRLSWNNHCPFDKHKLNSYYEMINDNLYLYKNLDADHSYRFIKDLLQYCKIDLTDAFLIVHRTPFGEPEEIVEKFMYDSQMAFIQYLTDIYGYPELKCKKIVNNIVKAMNPLLSNISKSYNNWFLFTDMVYVYSYVSKFNKYLDDNSQYGEKQIAVMKRYLTYIVNFYKSYID